MQETIDMQLADIDCRSKLNRYCCLKQEKEGACLRHILLNSLSFIDIQHNIVIFSHCYKNTWPLSLLITIWKSNRLIILNSYKTINDAVSMQSSIWRKTLRQPFRFKTAFTSRMDASFTHLSLWIVVKSRIAFVLRQSRLLGILNKYINQFELKILRGTVIQN